MRKRKLEEANWTALIISLLINCVFMSMYITEAIVGQRSWMEMVLFGLIVMITLGIPITLYFQDAGDNTIKYYIFLSFVTIYFYKLFTLKYSLTYIFAFISLVLNVMYLDYKLVRRVAIVIGVVNITRGLYSFLVLGYIEDGAQGYYLNVVAAILMGCVIIPLITNILIHQELHELENSKNKSSYNRF